MKFDGRIVIDWLVLDSILQNQVFKNCLISIRLDFDIPASDIKIFFLERDWFEAFLKCLRFVENGLMGDDSTS